MEALLTVETISAIADQGTVGVLVLLAWAIIQNTRTLSRLEKAVELMTQLVINNKK